MYDKELVEKDIFSKVLRAGRRTYSKEIILQALQSTVLNNYGARK